MTIVGRKRMNAVITADSGSSARGNAELRISRPPLVTERTPTVIELWTIWNSEQPGDEVREELGVARVRGAQDVDEDEVDERHQQRVEHQPQLPEGRVEVLLAQLRARQLDRELAAPPQLADVRAQGRQPDGMRDEDVALARELVFAAVRAGGWSGCSSAHSG